MKTLSHILLKPAVLAALTGVGLVAALVSDQTGDVLGWISLTCVSYVGVHYAVPWRSGPPRAKRTD